MSVRRSWAIIAFALLSVSPLLAVNPPWVVLSNMPPADVSETSKWIRIEGSNLTCVGQEYTYTCTNAEGYPGCNILWAQYVWTNGGERVSGGGLFDPTITIRWDTPGTNRVIVTHNSNATNSYGTQIPQFNGQAATALVTVINVEFDMDKPHRVGIGTNHHNRTQTLMAKVEPGTEVSNVTISVDGSKLSLSNVTITADKIFFDLAGSAKSITQGDSWIKAIHTSGFQWTNTVSVVIPGNIGTPHPTASGAAGQNMCINTLSSPVDPTVNSNHCRLGTFYGHFLVHPVVDQFAEDLGALYDGATVEQYINAIAGWHTINQPLSSSGSYQDPVGIWHEKDYTRTIVAAGSPEATAWLTNSLTPLIWEVYTNGVANTPQVKVDGFVLSPGIVNRTVSAGDPDIITIVWP